MLSGFSVRLFAFCALFVTCAAQAQLLPAKQDSFYSNILEQKRSLEVYLPKESEKDPAQRYETIYVLDGDWNSQIVVNVVTFMRQVGFMPPVIVVSVPNFFDEHGTNSRDHDLTPTVVADQPRSGGAAQFLSFLETELVPYVNHHYPANGTNLVHGHSYGGLFLIYVLLNQPALFDGYLILDPAMGWDKHALDATLDSKLGETPTKGKAIYIAARSGRAFEYMGISTIEPIFQRTAPADLHWKIIAYENETHDSLKLKGTYDALKYAYQGYTPDTVQLIPMAGILIKGKPMLMLAGSGRFDVHYTIDGSVPDESSPRVDETIAISDPEETTIKMLGTRGTYDRVIPHNLKSGKALPPAKRSTSGSTKSWHFAFYPAEAWPNIDKSRPFHTGDTDRTIDVSHAGRDNFAGSVERYLDIPADGYYVFNVESPEKVRLSVSGMLLIDNDGSHGHRQRAFVVPLRRGLYHARLEFQHSSKTSGVDLSVFQCKDGEREWWNNVLFKVSS